MQTGEARRRYADDGELARADDDAPAHDAVVAGQHALPEGVAHHYDRVRTARFLFVNVQIPTTLRLYAERREIVGAHERAACFHSGQVASELERAEAVGCERLDPLDPRAQ